MNLAEEFHLFSSQVQSLGNNFLWEATVGVSLLFYGKLRTAATFLRITYVENVKLGGFLPFP